MAIPEAQLQTWSHQGSVTQSRNTYQSVKGILDDGRAPYRHGKEFDSFLQGSYGNDTNVYRDSDVDVVMRLDSTFYHDVPTLQREQQDAFQRAYPGTAAYGLPEFKAEVLGWLRTHYGNVRAGRKALFIPGNGTRRDCDVLVCAKFRYYYRFHSELDQRYDEGICFFLPDGTQIVNFPKQHSANCTTKHQNTGEWFKPVVRMYKNMRNYAVDHHMLRDGVAPSYFIEGLLWNATNESFGRSFQASLTTTLRNLASADRSTFRCANGIHPLLSGSATSWNATDCNAFLTTMLHLWDNWQ
ncbi:MAG: nucleotidyltransferase [Rubrivivax sp.]|nr:nucleotidyltransferase [Rubrivivax sp.]